jgi:hypothetical protein
MDVKAIERIVYIHQKSLRIGSKSFQMLERHGLVV